MLITDILMPGMNGRELADRVLARAPATRVLFISGYAGEDVQLEDGARFLAKPFTPSELLEQVQSLLDCAAWPPAGRRRRRCRARG